MEIEKEELDNHGRNIERLKELAGLLYNFGDESEYCIHEFNNALELMIITDAVLTSEIDKISRKEAMYNKIHSIMMLFHDLEDGNEAEIEAVVRNAKSHENAH